ncbi:ferrochelatase [Acetobacter sp. TBRC 12305]|uniref:Ferrochelatase n=1 Tax=Acetobacter garciniae TaxID=2817435 RepID=A0A939HQ22_9PROT|nr:ferrochelatase [Acetobacter garciniae]MBO1326144.1 ferrochelatase [Acetobacter garciniae]MBX0345112.1 ferrochelatase [Acetobacter garciniae]
MVFHHIPAEGSDGQYPSGKPGVIVVNLGTPDDTGYGAVRRYLSEFLSDRRVIEGPPVLWQPILQGVVLSTRPRASGRAYARIWDTQRNESPLRGVTRRQAEKLAERLAVSGVPVVWGMRYGRPSLAEALHDLLRQGCDRILTMPLYPQYSATTTATANDQIFRALMKLRNQPALRTLPPFADDPDFIAALARSVRDAQAQVQAQAPSQAQPFQMVVASFHGLPKDYVAKGDSYAADCLKTVTALRAALGMDETTLPMTFQSRFGPAKWLEPYTAPFIKALPARGVTRIAVVMPGFMADCLETLDEIGNEVREEFLAAGGESFTLIPCLNDSPASIDLLEKLARRELAGWL